MQELGLCAEETGPLEALQESQSFRRHSVDHWPERQPQRRWVSNPCPDLPEHLDTHMAPQALKESGEYHESGNIGRGVRGVVRKGPWGGGRTEFKARERTVSDGHTEK